MSKILDLRARNYLCFGDVYVDLADKGVVGIAGENRSSSSRNNNGAGKSSLFEAISYGLFGESLRGISLKEVVRRASTGGSLVELRFQADDGHVYRVRRYCEDTEHGNGLFFEREAIPENEDLRGSKKKDTQENIVEKLGLSAEMFRQTALYGKSGMKRFSALSDPERKKLIEEILNIAIYEACGRVTRKAYTKKSGELSRLESKERHLQELLDVGKKRVEDSKLTIREWEKYKRERLEDAQKQIKILEEKIAEAAEREKEISLAGARISVLEDRLAALKEEKQDCENRKQGMMEMYWGKKSSISTELAKQQQKLNYLKSEQERIGTLVFEGMCPTCGQPTKDLVFEGEKDLPREMLQVQLKEGELGQALDNLEKAKDKVLRGIEQDKTEVEDSLRKVRQELEDERKRMPQMVSVEEARSSLEELVSFVESKGKEVCPHIDRLEKAEKEVVENEKKMEELLGQKTAVKVEREKLYLYMDIWKNVRSFIFENLLSEINEKLREYCQIVTQGELVAAISAQTSIASGEKREKTNVVVLQDGVETSYNSCSEGEKSRLDLPIALALQDVVAIRGKGVGLSLLDEVFESLDEVGVEGVMELLQYASRREHTTSIFAITHSQALQSLFTNTWTVVMEPNKVSRFVFS